VIGIVVKNIGAQIDFGLRLAEQLAHLERHELGELVAVSAQNGGCRIDDRLALGKRSLAPVVLERVFGFGDHRLQFDICMTFEGADQLFS
jgi:hypothetical protein